MLVKICIALLGAASVWPMIWILNRMPDKAFCDYDETPEDKHAAPRILFIKQGWLYAAVLAITYILLYRRFGISMQLFSIALLSIILAMITFSDFKFSIIPDELVIAAAAVALIAGIQQVVTGITIIDRLTPFLGAILGTGIILLLNLFGRIMFKKDAMGMGDVKLLAVCGLAVGHAGIGIAVLLGIFSAGLFFAVLIVLQRLKADQYYPMGPFLILGTMLTLCFYPEIQALIAWYVSLL